MDPAFEVTETRIPKKSRAQREAPGAEHFEADDTRPNAATQTGAAASGEVMTGTQSAPVSMSLRREETALSSANETPPGGFPRSIHGYNVAAVDDYVRTITGRLDALLSQIQSEISRADQSKRLLEQMTAELETMRRRASDAEKREVAALEAKKHAEEEALRLSQELKEVTEKSRLELEIGLAGRQDRDRAFEEQERYAPSTGVGADKAASAHAAEIERQVQPLRRDIEAIVTELAALRALGAGANRAESSASDGPAAAEALRVRLESELEAQRAFAHTEIERVIGEVRHAAEESTHRAASAVEEQAERVRTLVDACEALMGRLREAAEAQNSPAPSHARTLIRTATHPPARMEEADNRCVRDSREWRAGDWRTAS